MDILKSQEMPPWAHQIWDNKLYVGGALAGTYCLWKYMTTKKYNLPPGPSGWHEFTSDDIEADIKKFKDQYGDIFYVHSPANPMVYLTSYKMTKEAFITQSANFSQRPSQRIMRLVGFNDEIFIQSVSEKWTKLRKFAASALRLVGSTKSGLEAKTLTEVDEIVNFLRARNGQSIDCTNAVQNAAANIIHQILFGSRFDYDDERLGKFANLAVDFLTIFSLYSQEVSVLPDFIWKILNPTTAAKMRAVCTNGVNYARDRVIEHRKTFDPNNIRDLVDIFIQDRKDRPDVDWEQTNHTMFLFLPDAVHSITQNTLYTMLYLAKCPDWQQKIHREIDEISGGSQHVTLLHKANLPMTEAFIYEVMRITAVVSQTGLHCCHETSQLAGYDIPKEVPVVASLYHCMRDPAIFARPDEFDLSHFLSKEGKVVNTQFMVGFGIGKRMCMGEHISKTEIFLMISNLVKNFEIRLPEDEPEPSLKPIVGFNRGPQPFKVKLIPRE